MKRFFVLILILAIAAISLAGCSKGEKVIKVGVTDDYPPMGYRTSSDELEGFEVELAKELAKEMGSELEFVVIHREDMMGTLKDRTVDILISSVSMTKSKSVYLDFTDPYLANGSVIVTRPELVDTITSIESLAGMSAGVEAESTVDTIASDLLGKIDFTLVRYETMSVCIAALKAEQLDCIICDMAVAIDICDKFPDQFEISSAHLTNEPLGIAVNLGNEKLVHELNDALAALKKDGVLSELSEKYLGEDYTQNIDTTLQ
ncbi:MAG: transporter substrate-binding domain-containing protein [Eubacteriales bacterium]